MSDRPGVSNGVISTPEGGGAIRGIGETFSPDLHTGTGNFTVPISLPDGRNDFQPELNLVYSTGNGNGEFGFGWDLTVPGVTRKTSEGVPRYRDDADSPSDWDTFVLSGTEDLVPVAVWEEGGPGDDALVQNENPTEDAFATASVVQFRPRTEGSFARIRHHCGGHDDYWEVERTDGQVSYYGTPAPDDADEVWEDPAVVADPQGDGDVFAWKLTETRDSFGNRIVYDYERDRQVTESGGRDQLYLKRIRYADYGSGDNSEFLVSVDFDYEDRPDPFSDYRAGFEIRTRKRCARITVSTHTEEDRRFKTYELTYLDQRGDLEDLEARLPLNGVSLLSQLRVTGHDDGARQALPPLEFGHTRFRPTEREFAPVEGTELPAESLGAPDLELTDLFGDGLPDVVEIDGRVRYWRNEGGGEFDRPRSMARSPAGLALADPDVQLLDADGNGRADLMTDRDGLSGYFPLDFSGEWSREGFRRYDRAPSVDLQDPEVRLVDLTGDGVTDAVRSGSRFECYFNNPDAGWSETRRVQRGSLETFPDVELSDPRVRWADMTGDGLDDVVLLYDGNVEYWPNLGYGNWGRRVHMAESPHFESGYDPERLLLGDVDGDGAADLVYVTDDAVTLWVNRSGNGWSDPVEVDGTPSVTDATDLRLVDLLGTGVAGVLWSADASGRGRDHTFFLDFTGRTKPYLLNEMDNNMGAVTRVEYGTSTEHLLDDRADSQTRGQPPLPFPVQVVDRVEVIDAISRSKQTREYAYHHGYWDGDEREFRGFGMVEQYDTETFTDYNEPGLHGEDVAFRAVEDREQFSPPTLTKTWFHQGAVGPARGEWHRADYSEDYWDGDEQLLGEAASLDAFLDDSGVPRRAKRDALRALRGRVVRRERYGLDGSDREDRPYTVLERSHRLREEDAPDSEGTDRLRVFFPHTVAERTTRWERGRDPLTTLTFRGDFDEHGQPRRETRVAPPRRSARRVGTIVAERGHLSGDELNETQVLATHTRTEYAGPQGDSFIHDRVAQERTVALREPPALTESDPDDVAQVLREQVEAARSVRRTFVDAMDAWRTNHSLPSTVRLVGHAVNHYDGSAFQGLSPGEVDDYGALTRSETLVFRDEQLDEVYGNRRPAYLDGSASLPNGVPGDVGQDLGYRREQPSGEYHAGYYVDTARLRYDVQDDATDKARGVVTAKKDPLGHRTTIEPDEYWVRPKRVTDAAGLEREAEYDYRVLKPRTVRDPNGHATHLRYTPLGQVHKRFLESRDGAGGSESKPEVRYEYDFEAYERTSENDEPQPMFVHAVQRVHHGTESSSDETIELREYSDGFGRLVQRRTQAPERAFSSPGDVGLSTDQDVTLDPAHCQRDPNRVVVSGWQVYDNKGRVVENYEPFFASGWDYDPETDARQGQHVTQHYDPVGRVVRTVNPDGSQQRVVVGTPTSPSSPEPYQPTPWERYTYDANDNAGRTHPAEPELDSVDHHWNTPIREVRDALGRTIAVVEHTREPGQQRERDLTQSRYDIRGNETEIVDPMGRSAVEYAHDLLDNRLYTESIDAGLETVVRDAVGNPVETRDSKGSVVLREYDELNRLTHLWARDDDSASRATLRERRLYGDDDAVDRGTARDGNLLGRVYEQYDEAGLVRFEGYDFKGNVAEKRRRVVSDEALSGGWTADWNAANADADLEASDYLIETAYDALDRPTHLTYPTDVDGDRATLSPTYDHGGRLERVALDGTPYVAQIAYNARGQRTLVAYGNDVMTRYAYDSETFRLARLRTETVRQGSNPDRWEGTGAPFQDFAYAYDLVGNLLSVDDRTPDSGVPGTSDGANRLVRTFEYDPRYRLTRATGREHDVSYPKPDPWDDRQGYTDPAQTREYERGYSYDAADNVQRLRHVADGETIRRDFETASGSNRIDRVAVAEDTTTRYDYGYDDSGNLIREGTDRGIDWDHADRMRSFQLQAGSSDSSVEGHYLYDAAGQRVKKLVEAGGTAKSTTYIDGAFEHRRWRRGSALEHENNRLHVMDDRKRIALVRRGPPHPDDSKPAVQYHFGDHLGSSNVLIDASGQRVNREEYFPYGETSFGSFAGKRYRFTGNERDEHDAPYYHRSRYYAPWLARWTSPDPEGVLDGINLYQYARTNPLRYVDPGGTQSEPSTPADDDGGGYGLGTLLSVLLPARTEPLKKSRDIDLEGLSPATKKYLKMAQVTDESRPLLQIHGAPVEMYHAFFPSKRHIRHASIEELRDIIERDEWAITVLKPIKYAGDVAQLYLTVQSAGTSAVAMSGVKSASTASKLKLVYHAKKLQAAAVWTGFEAMQLTRNTVGLLRGKRVTHEYGEMVAGKEGKMVQLSRESFLALSDLYRGNKAEKTLGALQLLTNFVEARDLSRGRRKLVKENLTETEFEQLKRLRKDNIQTKQTK